ncbi:MAG: Outer membrane efflux protein BepC precursor [Bacteroidetes bacterium ADurb.BinA245]|nr:MAG: Outer membrane efflux protein BepC precursor [Bacteroidetes bacterium ADurb.BinA245]
MILRSIGLIALLFISTITFSQSSEKWDLKKCVDYAWANNISIRQSILQKDLTKLDWEQSKSSQRPTANFNTNLGYSAGRNQDPTSFDLTTIGYFNNNYSLQASVDLFNWFSKKNTIAMRDFNVQAATEGVEKAKNDFALNIAVAYLQILLAREQENLAKSKIEQTQSQLESTRKQVAAGKLPELNAVNLEAALSADSSNLIAAQTSAQQFLLQMKSLLNLDAGQPFDIVTPPVSLIPVENLADLQPEAVYQLAINNMPQQKMDELNIKAALRSVEIAKAERYPTISLFGSLGTGFNNRAKEIKSATPLNLPIGNVTIGATQYNVFPNSPINSYEFGKIGYFNQLNQNFRQSIGIGVSIPIANGGVLKTNWQRSKLNVKQAELEKEKNSFTLKQDIYKAYYDAVAAVQKYHANKKTVSSAQLAYDYAVRRYEVGLISTYDLITTQTTLQQAKSQLLYAEYDYVFKLKLLEFYKGQGLKL